MVEACVMKNDISLESFSSSSKSAENAEKHCSKNLEMKKKKKSAETDRIFLSRDNKGFILKLCFIQ